MKNLKLHILIISFLFVNLTFAQWVLRNNGISESGNTIAESIDAPSSNFVVISYGTHLYKTNDTGMNWVEITPAGNIVIDVSAVDSSHIWAATDRGRILVTTNGGNSWAEQFYDPSKTLFMNYIKMFNPDSGIAMGDANDSNILTSFLRTTNGGLNWVQVNTNLVGAYSNDTWRVLDFPDIMNGYFGAIRGTESGIYKTTDGGATWVTTNRNTDANFTRIKFYNKNIGIVAPRWGTLGVTRTFDGLANVDTVRDQKLYYAQRSDIEFVPGDPSKILYTNYSSIFFSTDTGKTWQYIPLQANDNPSFCEDIVFTDSEHCWLLCDNGKVYYTSNINSVITGVEKTDNTLPERYILEQNYPNPFNPSTVIKFKILEAGFVTLKVYDLLGREIKTLVNEYKNSGSFSYRFDAVGLASGVYLYELKVNDYATVKKLVLLR